MQNDENEVFRPEVHDRLTPWQTDGTLSQGHLGGAMTKDIVLIKKDFLAKQSFWNELTTEEKNVVRSESEGFAKNLEKAFALRAEMGEQLLKLKKVLHGRFNRYLATAFNFSPRNGHRLIERYINMTETLPEYAWRPAAARGMDLVGYNTKNPYGAYSEALKRLPVPSTPKEVPVWLDKLEEGKKLYPVKKAKPARDPDKAIITAYKCGARGIRMMPAGKERHRWGLRLIGYLMAEFGLPAQTVHPEAIPDEFRRGAGRPKGRTVK